MIIVLDCDIIIKMRNPHGIVVNMLECDIIVKMRSPQGIVVNVLDCDIIVVEVSALMCRINNNNNTYWLSGPS